MEVSSADGKIATKAESNNRTMIVHSTIMLVKRGSISVYIFDQDSTEKTVSSTNRPLPYDLPRTTTRFETAETCRTCSAHHQSTIRTAASVPSVLKTPTGQ
jgi:hypothetical protein